MAAPYLLVLAHQRSGSNHLFDLLRGFVGVTTLGEFFNITASAPGKMHQADALAQYDGSIEQFLVASENNPLDPLSFRDNVPDTTLFVIKLFGNQLKSKRARRILVDNAVGVIHLRRNVFSTSVSRELAKRSGEWFNESSENAKVTFVASSFIRYASRITTFAVDFSHIIRQSNRPSLDFTFSEVSAMTEPRQVADRISSAFPELPALRKRNEWKPLVTRQDGRLPIYRVENAEQARVELAKLGLEYLLENEDTDDAEFLHSVFARRQTKSGWRTVVAKVFRR